MIRFPSPSLVVSMLALVVALGGAGYSATGGNFFLGKTNDATTQTRLVAPIAGASLRVDNLSTGASSTGLGIFTDASRPPFRINSKIRVANLNADLIDGLDSTAFAPSTSEGWHYIGAPGEPVFVNSWINEDDTNRRQLAAYRIDSNHVVHIRGVVKSGTVNLAMFELPPAYCPLYQHIFAVVGNSAFARLDVFPRLGSATCSVVEISGSNAYVSLEGVRYLDEVTDSRIAAPP